MKGLRKAADESEEKLRASVDRATVLANDLSDVADRAEKVFAVIERSRAEKKPLTPSAESKVTFKEEDDADAAPLTDAQRAKKQAVLEKMLEKVANARKESDAKPEKKSDSVKKSATGKKLSKVV